MKIVERNKGEEIYRKGFNIEEREEKENVRREFENSREIKVNNYRKGFYILEREGKKDY